MSASQSSISYFLPDETATQRFGEDFALALQKGDLVTLSGDLGRENPRLPVRSSGQSLTMKDWTFQARLSRLCKVTRPCGFRSPMPTFTVFRTAKNWMSWDCRNLWRMAWFWPNGRSRARVLPEPSFAVTLSHEGAGRRIAVSGPVAAISRLERSRAIRAFLDSHGRSDATRRYFQGDAGPRRYELIASAVDDVEVLMNAPAMSYDPPLRNGKSYRQLAHIAENIQAFVAIDGLLAKHGFRAPQMRAMDIDAGLLILENLGTEGVRAASGEPVAERYEAAGRFLAHLHGITWPNHAPVAGYPDHIIAGFDRDAMMIEVSLIGQWYAPRMMGRKLTEAEKQAFEAAWDRVIADIADVEKSLLLRDYHSPNLFWFPEAQGKDRIGVIDFQDAMIGPAAYDVASLALDARVTISPELEQAVVAAYCDERRALGHAFDEASFRKAYAAMGAQRNAKLLGLFVRLDERDGKPAYLEHLPRIHDYLGRVLKHPVMAPVAAWFEELGLMQQEEAAQ